LFDALGGVDLKGVGIVIISKSGGTLEQLSVGMVLYQMLVSTIGEVGACARTVCVMGKGPGALQEIAQAEGFATVAIPESVGGRFSVLSSVGLLPILFAGVDGEALLRGAQGMEGAVFDVELTRNPALQFALTHWYLYQEGRFISVCMPYRQRLQAFGMWYRQLWAESLGKQVGTHAVSPWPVAALGPTDHHSQLQLYMEGDARAVITLITVEASSQDYTLPSVWQQTEVTQKLQGKPLSQLLDAQARGTRAALGEAGRPWIHLQLDVLDAEHLGALFFFYEVATSYAGALFGVNTYDQPGVEASKQKTRAVLGI